MKLIDLIHGPPARRRLVVIIWPLVGALVCGCDKSPYPVAPVHGRVTIDGRPFAGGKVMFAPIAQADSTDCGKPAFGPLQPDGSFVLTTFDDSDGAVVGEHWATIIASPDAAVSASTSVPKFVRMTVPRKLVVVAGQDNEIEITLTSREITRFGRRKP